MTKSVAQELVIKGVRQLRAMGSPSRVRILEALLEQSPLSIKETAAQLGTKTVPLYHHFKILLASGLIREAGLRGQGRAAEMLYTPAARAIRIQGKFKTRLEREELARVGETHARHVTRRYVRSIASGKAELEGQARTASVRHVSLQLSKARLAALNAEINAFTRKWNSFSPETGETRISLLIMLAPTER